MKFKPFSAAFPLLLAFFLLIVNANYAQNQDTDFVSIFDGETLNGWSGDTTYWRVEDGSLVGEVTPETILERNSFIIWQGGQPENFELKLEYRVSADGNSGVNYRSSEVEGVPFALRGYQCDIDGRNRYTGQNYEERGRTTLAYRGEVAVVKELPDSAANLPVRNLVERNAWTNSEVIESLGSNEELNEYVNEGWNSCHIIVNGNNMQHYVNGKLMSEITDNDTRNRTMKGLIGVQVHVGPPMTIEYRNIQLKTL